MANVLFIVELQWVRMSNRAGVRNEDGAAVATNAFVAFGGHIVSNQNPHSAAVWTVQSQRAPNIVWHDMR